MRTNNLSSKLIIFISVLVLASASLIIAPKIEASIPRKLNYQGQLKDSNNNPVTTATTIKFAIYATSTGGSELWSETYNQAFGTCSKIMPDFSGMFSAQLGNCVSLPTSLDFNQQYYLGLTIESNAEASPRVPLSSVPYAENVRNVTFDGGSSNAFKIGTESKDFINFDSTVGNELVNIATNALIGTSSTSITFGGIIQGTQPFVFEGGSVNGLTTTFNITDPTTNQIINFPNASGTVVLDTTFQSFITGNYFLQGGNSFGATGVLGTKDNNNLNIITNNTLALTVDTSQNISAVGRLGLWDGTIGADSYLRIDNSTRQQTSGDLYPIYVTATNNSAGGDTFGVRSIVNTGAGNNPGALRALRGEINYSTSGTTGTDFLLGVSGSVQITNGTPYEARSGNFIVNNSASNPTGYMAGLFTDVQNSGDLATVVGIQGQSYNLTTANSMTGFNLLTYNFGTISGTSSHPNIVSGASGVKGLYSEVVSNTARSVMGMFTYIDSGDVTEDVVGEKYEITTLNSSILGDTIGSDLLITNSGTGIISGDLLGNKIDLENISGGTVTGNIRGIDLTVQNSATAANLYGIYLNSVVGGTNSNYGVYIAGASGGSGTNASLWVNSGLSRFAPATTTSASLQLASSSGTNVSSPNSGDLWWNGTNLYFNDGSINVDLLAAAAGACPTCFTQGGNAFGVSAVLGTTDTNSLSLITDSTTALTIDTNQDLTAPGRLALWDATVGTDSYLKIDNATRTPSSGNAYGINLNLLTTTTTDTDILRGVFTTIGTTATAIPHHVNGARNIVNLGSTGTLTGCTLADGCFYNGTSNRINGNAGDLSGTYRYISAYEALIDNSTGTGFATTLSGGTSQVSVYRGIENINSTISNVDLSYLQYTSLSGANITSMTGNDVMITHDVGTINTIRGQEIWISDTAATTNLYGAEYYFQGASAATGDVFGINISQITASSSTNVYGIYIGGVSGASNTNASIWVEAGLSRFAPATTSGSSINLASSTGTNPSAPISGDLWWNGTNLNFRTGSSTVDLLAAGGGCATCFDQGGNAYGALATLGTTDGNDLQIITNNTEKARFDTAGNMGIGVTVPAAVLDIARNNNVATTTLFGAQISLTNQASGALSNGMTGLTMRLNNNTGGTNDFPLYGIDQSIVNDGTTGAFGWARGITNAFTNNNTITGTLTSAYNTISNTLGASVTESIIGTDTNITNAGDATYSGILYNAVYTGTGNLGTSVTYGGSLIGYQADLINDTGGVVGSGSTGDIMGTNIIIRGGGNVNGNVYGSRYDVRPTGTYNNAYGARYDFSGGLATTSSYGIYLNTVNTGTVNDYALYINGASGGSGTNASIWVESGLSRFAAATTTASSVRLNSSGGTDPSTPVSGDLWWNGTNLYFNNGAINTDLLAAAAGACPTCFVQNGNSFGALAVLGTNDGNALALETNNATRIQIGATDGEVSFLGNSAGADGISIGSFSGGTNAFGYNRNVATGAIYDATLNAYQWGHTANLLTLSTWDNGGNLVNGNTMVITGAGLVGLGVASPTSATLSLGVATTTLASLNIGDSVGVNPAAPATGDLWWNGTNFYFYNGTSSIDLLAAGGGCPTCFAQNGNSFGTGAVLGTSDTNSLTIITDNTTAVTIDTGGNVGIGTTTTSNFKLTVNGDIGPAASPTRTVTTSSSYIVTSTGTITGGVDPTYPTPMVILDDDLPAFLYRDATLANNSNLYYVKCNNSTCTIPATVLIASDVKVGPSSMYALGVGSDGNPIISYVSTPTTDQINYIHCVDKVCSGTLTPVVVYSIGSTVFTNSIISSKDGMPLIEYYDDDAGEVGVIKCSDIACSSTSGASLATTANAFNVANLKLDSDGMPILVINDTTTFAMTFLRCADFGCSVVVTTAMTSTGTVMSQAINSDGYPIVLFADSANTDAVSTYKCNDLDCSTGTIGDLSLGSAVIGGNITIANDGMPLVSAINTTSGGSVYTSHCLNSSCTSVDTGTLIGLSNVSNSQTTTVGILKNGLPIVAYGDNDSTATLYFYQCTNSNCNNVDGIAYTGGSNIGSPINYFNNVYAVKYNGKNFAISNFDLAEAYEVEDSSIAAGDVVRLKRDSTNTLVIERAGGEGDTYDSSTIGVISTEPGLYLQNWEDNKTNTRPLALAGRVPVKVTDENGPINRGDLLTASSKPGYAMKATNGGMIIGRALEDFSSSIVVGDSALVQQQLSEDKQKGEETVQQLVESGEIDETQVEEAKQVVEAAVNTVNVIQYGEGRIMMFVDLGYVSNDILNPTLAAASTVQGSGETIQTAGDSTDLQSDYEKLNAQILDLQKQVDALTIPSEVTTAEILNVLDINTITKLQVTDLIVTGTADISSLTVATATFTGDVTVKSHLNLSQDSVGQAKILSGATSVRVNFAQSYSSEPIVTITPIGIKEIKYGVENITKDGFDVVIDTPFTEDLTFNWHVFGNAGDSKIFVSDGTSESMQL